MTSPKVVYNSIFTLAVNNIDAKYKTTNFKRVESMYDYYTNEDKRAMSMYDYYTGKLTKDKTMNLVLENGKYADEEEVARRKKRAVKYLQNSNLWQGVLSFNNSYINENINIHDLEKILATSVLPRFFKKCGFKDPKKMFYQLSLHTDTDNLHFHFSFMEKEPNYEYSRNNIKYRRYGKLTTAEIDFLKAQVVLAIEREKIYTPLLKEANKEIDDLKKYFNPKERNFLLYDKKDLLLEEKILRLGKLLYEDRNGKDSKIKYGSITNPEIKNLTKEIKSYLFSSRNENFRYEYNNFKTSLNNINEYFKSIYTDNNCKNILVDTTLTDSKQKYIDNYIYNSIVNHSNYIYTKELRSNTKIHEKDIIQEIIYQQYLKNKNQNKKDILKSYLSSNIPQQRFKNKNAIEQAIRNINSEMEEAQKEFSKLFQSDSYSKKL